MPSGEKLIESAFGTVATFDVAGSKIAMLNVTALLVMPATRPPGPRTRWPVRPPGAWYAVSPVPSVSIWKLPPLLFRPNTTVESSRNCG